jgi:hypothetical protein
MGLYLKQINNRLNGGETFAKHLERKARIMYDNFLSCYDIDQLLIDLNSSLVAFRQMVHLCWIVLQI